MLVSLQTNEMQPNGQDSIPRTEICWLIVDSVRYVSTNPAVPAKERERCTATLIRPDGRLLTPIFYAEKNKERLWLLHSLFFQWNITLVKKQR
jgi:hypothetical protein